MYKEPHRVFITGLLRTFCILSSLIIALKPFILMLGFKKLDLILIYFCEYIYTFGIKVLANRIPQFKDNFKTI